MFNICLILSFYKNFIVSVFSTMQAKVSYNCELLIIILGCADKFFFCERPSDLYRAFKPSTCVCSSASSYLMFFFFLISFFLSISVCVPFASRFAVETHSNGAGMLLYFGTSREDLKILRQCVHLTISVSSFSIFSLTALKMSIASVARSLRC